MLQEERCGLRQTASEDVILPSMLLTKPLCCELNLYAANYTSILLTKPLCRHTAAADGAGGRDSSHMVLSVCLKLLVYEALELLRYEALSYQQEEL